MAHLSTLPSRVSELFPPSAVSTPNVRKKEDRARVGNFP